MLTSLLALALTASGQLGDGVPKQDRSGPPRQAHCRIDGEPVQRCVFTPVFGDGSFDIKLNGDRELRVMIDGTNASVFEVLGPQKRVPLMWRYRRDPADQACWVSDRQSVSPKTICVYSQAPAK